MLGAGALGRPRGMVWGGRREEGSGWGTKEKELKKKKKKKKKKKNFFVKKALSLFIHPFNRYLLCTVNQVLYPTLRIFQF